MSDYKLKIGDYLIANHSSISSARKKFKIVDETKISWVVSNGAEMKVNKKSLTAKNGLIPFLTVSEYELNQRCSNLNSKIFMFFRDNYHSDIEELPKLEKVCSMFNIKTN